MEVLVKEVHLSDIAQLLALADRANEVQVLPLLSEEGRLSMRKATRASASQFGNRRRYSGLKAVLDSKIVGYVVWRDGFYVSQLYVDPPFHRKGIGGRLMKEVLKRASSFPLKLRASPNALGFYENFGFRAIDVESSDNGIRYVPMEYDSVEDHGKLS